MGYFDLPRGRVDLNLKPKKGGKYDGWTNVMMTDVAEPESIASLVEDWSKGYTVLGARFNGRDVEIPKNYHWELRDRDGEVLAKHKTHAEAAEDAKDRRLKRRTDPTVKVGGVWFKYD